MRRERKGERVCVDTEAVSVSAFWNLRMQKTIYRNRKHLDVTRNTLGIKEWNHILVIFLLEHSIWNKYFFKTGYQQKQR